MKTIATQAHEILTAIKLGSHATSQQYEVVWGENTGNYCLSWMGHKMTNKQALDKIKTVLQFERSKDLITGVISRVTQSYDGIEIKEGQQVLYRWIPENEDQEESGDFEGFQISVGDRWIDANSIDFEFTLIL